MATFALLLSMCTHLSVSALLAEVRVDRRDGAFVVAGWRAPAEAPPAGWNSLFELFVDSPGSLPILGAFAVVNQELRFTPKYPLAPSIALRAVFRPPGSAPVETRFAAVEGPKTGTTAVAGVYPSGDRIPANLLKFYLHFSAPMSRGDAWNHIRLMDSKGEALDLPFLEIDQELWDPQLQRLTVLFDPGRIKRGVMPREQSGGALEPGASYTLHVDAAWKDATGLPLARPFEKRFHVLPEDRTAIDPKQWKLRRPPVGTRDALVVELGEPLDRALLERMITVRSGGSEVSGAVAITDGETKWRFVPAQEWSPGECALVVDTILEDLAGNKVGRAFDVDTFERVTRRVSSATVSIPFRIGPQ